MIEVDSCYPSEWDNWDSSNLQPYLELYGEAQPFVCTNLTETLPANSMNNDPQMSAIAPIYEYFWTIGISKHLFNKFAQHAENIVDSGVDKFRHLDTGAEVTMYFPLTGGWRVEEVVASIKYVRPLPHRDDLVKKVADYWETVGPVVGKVADLTEHLNIPGVSTGASLINALAKVPITSLPPVEGLSWSIQKITGYENSEIMDGVKWTLPPKLFYILGSRVTGSIAVYFHPAQSRQKQHEIASTNQIMTQMKPILARASIHINGEEFSNLKNNGNEYLELEITPKAIPAQIQTQPKFDWPSEAYFHVFLQSKE